MNLRTHKMRIYLALAVWLGILATGCEREPRVAAYSDPGTIEERYGLTGAYGGRINTGDGSLDATIIPITLSDGRSAQLVIPKNNADGNRILLRDADGIAPVVLENPRMSREEFVRSQPRVVVQERAAQPKKNKRSWQKEALIIGGSSGAGAAIGAAAGGGKGAAIGAISGGVAGLIYDLATRNK
jgi:hypothetical protein